MKRLWSEMTEAELVLHGCAVWDRRQVGEKEIVHYLIPVRYYHELDEGDELVSIDGKTVRVGADHRTPGTDGYIDGYTRGYGMLGYGVQISKAYNQLE